MMFEYRNHEPLNLKAGIHRYRHENSNINPCLFDRKYSTEIRHRQLYLHYTLHHLYLRPVHRS